MKVWVCTEEHLCFGKHFEVGSALVVDDHSYPISYNNGWSHCWRQLMLFDLIAQWEFENFIDNRIARTMELYPVPVKIEETDKKLIQDAAWFGG